MTLAVLHRSAAWLALDCEDPWLAEQLASAGLAGDPPPVVAEQLRQVREQANLYRHLSMRGIVLSDHGLQMTLSGPGVGSGVTAWAGYRARVDDTLKMITRITERKAGRKFRRGGPPEAAIRDYLSPHVSQAKAASYSVTIVLGGGQLRLPGVRDLPALPEVIDEFLSIVESVDERGKVRLEELIADDLYRRHALMLARRIAPDGTDIKQVGFAASGVAGPRVVGFTRLGRDAQQATAALAGESPGQMEIQGELQFEDARIGRQ